MAAEKAAPNTAQEKSVGGGNPNLSVAKLNVDNGKLTVSRLSEQAEQENIRLHIAPLRLCTDNAVMGAIAVERLKAGLVEPLTLEVYPGVVRGQQGQGGRVAAARE